MECSLDVLCKKLWRMISHYGLCKLLAATRGGIVAKPVSGVKKLLGKLVSLEFFIASARLLQIAKYYK